MKTATKTKRQSFARLRFLALLMAVGFAAGCGSDSGTDLLSGDTTGTAVQADSSTDTVLNRGGGSQPQQLRQQQPPPPPGDSSNPPPPDGVAVTEARSVDGSGNNRANPALGSVGGVYYEDTTRAYGDGVNTPSGEDRPNARDISNAVFDQTEDTPDAGGRTAYLWLWGQFVDHDITLTDTNGLNDFPIAVPTGDPYFDPTASGTQEMAFSRSLYDELTGTDASNPRAQYNSITTFIDASNVYGSDSEKASDLRAFEGGKMKTGDGNLPPFDDTGVFFYCGDVRANENVLLTSMHTVFLREHNRIADQVARRHPELNDEEIYQIARKRVGAELQAITYNEFLPAMLGQDALPPYQGYKPNGDPRVGILFNTAAYRLGHSQVGSTVPRLDENGNEISEGNLTIATAFFNPAKVSEAGIEPLLRGAASEPSQATDAKIIGDLRNFLFGPPGAGGLDLASLNIQRGRDHGLPDYNTVRQYYGLPPANDFTQVTSNATTQNELAAVYSSPSQIDPWVGMLAEDTIPGSVVGPTLRRVLTQQFRRLRDGDRFFYLNDPDLAQVRDELKQTRLADVIARNTGITGLQHNIFFEARPESRPRPPQQQPRRIPAPDC